MRTGADLYARPELAGHATAGDILAWRRRRAGLSIPQLARADGRWEPTAVVAVESSRAPSGADVTRYLRALERALEETAS